MLVIWVEFGRRRPSAGDALREEIIIQTVLPCLWQAGRQPGFRYGATDDFGYHAIEDRMNIHDWHATLLHLKGIDHEQLTYFHQGRNFRLTDVSGEVAHKMLMAAKPGKPHFIEASMFGSICWTLFDSQNALRAISRTSTLGVESGTAA